MPVAPSPEPFYWDIVIDFPSPLGPAAPDLASPTPETADPGTATPALKPESKPILQTQVAAIIPVSTATAEAPQPTAAETKPVEAPAKSFNFSTRWQHCREFSESG